MDNIQFFYKNTEKKEEEEEEEEEIIEKENRENETSEKTESDKKDEGKGEEGEEGEGEEEIMTRDEFFKYLTVSDEHKQMFPLSLNNDLECNSPSLCVSSLSTDLSSQNTYQKEIYYLFHPKQKQKQEEEEQQQHEIKPPLINKLSLIANNSYDECSIQINEDILTSYLSSKNSAIISLRRQKLLIRKHNPQDYLFHKHIDFHTKKLDSSLHQYIVHKNQLKQKKEEENLSLFVEQVLNDLSDGE